MTEPAPTTYDSRAIFFHWLAAALILLLWGMGETIDWFPRGDPRMFARSAHIALGVVLALVLAARIHWRVTGARRLPPAESGARGRAAVGMHHLLYLLMTVIVVLGIAAVWIRGDNLFNLYKVPSIAPGNKALREAVVDLHETVANALLVLALLHAAMALWHHAVVKDGVLARMWPALKKNP